MSEELMAMIESLVQEHYGTQGLEYLRQRTRPAPAVQVLDGYAERRKWTTREWAEHVGAVEDATGGVRFGSWMAVRAMLLQFQEVYAAPTPAPVATEAVAQDVEKVIDALPDDWSYLAYLMLNAGAMYWRAAVRERGPGAVQWLRGDDGALFVFTRGEYADELVSAVKSVTKWPVQEKPVAQGMVPESQYAALLEQYRDLQRAKEYCCCGDCPPREPVAQGGGVDVEKVMALVREYFEVGLAYGYDGRGHDDERGTAVRLNEEIRALLASPAGVGSAEARSNPSATRQYFFKDDSCKASKATDADCICWHDEGTGPFPDGTDIVKLEWRDKTPAIANQGEVQDGR